MEVDMKKVKVEVEAEFTDETEWRNCYEALLLSAKVIQLMSPSPVQVTIHDMTPPPKEGQETSNL